MEYCMEAKALKSSLLSETAMKPTTQQVEVDDIWGFNGIYNSDDFCVDDLLDFSNKEPFLEENEYLCHDKGVDGDDDKSFNFTSRSSGGFDSLPPAELTVPVTLHICIFMLKC